MKKMKGIEHHVIREMIDEDDNDVPCDCKQIANNVSNKRILMKSILTTSIILTCLFLVNFDASAQTTTWTGASGTNWHNPANWTMGVPTPAMDAQIPASSIVDIGAPAMARSVRNEGDLTVYFSGTLDIQNSPSTGLVNFGNIFNEGAIEVKGMGQHAVENFPGGAIKQLNGASLTIGDMTQIVLGSGILNYGIIDNQSGADILVQFTGLAAINNQYGQIENNGDIEIIDASAEGLLNKGLVTIASGSLSIKNVITDGIKNSGTISNDGIITVDNVGAVGLLNGFDSMTVMLPGLINNLTGQMDISKTTFEGLKNYAGEIVNESSLNISKCMDVGLLNESMFSNLSAGNIDITMIEVVAVVNLDSFINNATLGIHDNILGNAIENYAVFENQPTGDVLIQIVDGTGLLNFAMFSNALGGDLLVQQVGNMGIINRSGTFENFGSIELYDIAEIGFLNESNFSNQGFAEIEISNVDTTALVNTDSFVNDAFLTIHDSINVNGIDNHGIFENRAAGEIQIDYVDGNGIENFAVFENQSSSHITLQNIAGSGLINFDIFTNSAAADMLILQIGSTGIENESGRFVNLGNMELDDIVGIGVLNQSIYINQVPGQMELTNIDTTALVNNDTFINNALLSIHHEINESGIKNHDIFENRVSGEINITHVDSNGIENLSDFLNIGLIEIDSAHRTGIVNGSSELVVAGEFENTGEINVSISGLDGVENQMGIFKNDNLLSIRGVTGNGLVNSDEFTNGPSGELTIINSTRHGILNYGLLSNHFELLVDSSGFTGIVNGSMMKEGRLINVTGQLQIWHSNVNGIENVNGLCQNFSDLIINDIDSLCGLRNLDSFVNELGASIVVNNAPKYGVYNNGDMVNHELFVVDTCQNLGFTNGFSVNPGHFVNKNGLLKIHKTDGYAFVNAFTSTFINADSVYIAAIDGEYSLINTGQFNNLDTAYLVVGKASGVGMTHYGTKQFINDGKISIVDTFSSRGLMNGGNFYNNVGGELSIECIAPVAIYTYGDTIFNAGLIDIIGDFSQYGIENRAVLYNDENGLIQIDNAGSIGLRGEFSNSHVFNHGDIAIGPSVNIGIRFINASEFDNFGNVQINNTNSGFIMVQADTRLTNHLGGSIQIDSISNIGMSSVSTASIINNGNIAIQNNSGGHGLIASNGGTIDNLADGYIEITNIGSTCIYTQLPGTRITNYGVMEATMGPGVLNDGIHILIDTEFENVLGAELIINNY